MAERLRRRCSAEWPFDTGRNTPRGNQAAHDAVADLCSLDGRNEGAKVIDNGPGVFWRRNILQPVDTPGKARRRHIVIGVGRSDEVLEGCVRPAHNALIVDVVGERGGLLGHDGQSKDAVVAIEPQGVERGDQPGTVPNHGHLALHEQLHG